MIPEPFLTWLHAIIVFLRENDEKALFLLLLVEESGVPLPAPGDIVIMFAGYRVFTGEMQLIEAGLAVTLAVQLGSTILYTLSRKLGHTLLFKYGEFIHLDQSRLEKVERWIHRHGPVMVLVGRLTPGLRTPTSIMAGVFEVPFRHFFLYATLSALIWSGFWLASGYFFGKRMIPLLEYLHYSSYAGILLVAGVLGWIALQVYKERGRRARGAAVRRAD
ncbi:MAG TPA: DedA family protein [Chloroflexota bacterium]